MRATPRVHPRVPRLRCLMAAAALFLASGAAALAQAAPSDTRPTVAVLPSFDNGSLLNHADYDALGKGSPTS